MNHQKIKENLRVNVDVFKYLFQSVSDEQARWKPGEDKWSILEVINHLYDEEREDFRFRIKWVLERPDEIPPPFNPINWVTDHNYMQQDYSVMLEKFFKERESSLIWLKSLENANWNNSFEHPKLGTMSAKYFLNNWLAHDYLHIRQIVKLKFDYLNNQFEENLDYAGIW